MVRIGKHSYFCFFFYCLICLYFQEYLREKIPKKMKYWLNIQWALLKANTFILYHIKMAFCITSCVFVSKCYYVPICIKTAKCLHVILLDAETDWEPLNYNLNIWRCAIVSPYCVCI